MLVETIAPAEIGRLMKSGRSLNIFDVRTAGKFRRLHARGAQSMPLNELDPATITARRSDANEPIYVICQSGGRAAKAWQRLKRAGIGPVYSIEGGTVAWQRLGLPIERGQRGAISMERQVRIGAGSLVLLGVGLAWQVNSLFLILPSLVGAGLVFAGVTDYCGMALLLGKMPWNRGSNSRSSCPPN